MTREISGDARLSATDRLRYLGLNLVRNLRLPDRRFTRRSFCEPRLETTRAAASPGRALTEAFIQRGLPTLLPPGPIRVLEIGCGSGSLTAQLAAAGYTGSYLGVDIQDRFRHEPEAAFIRTFVEGDMQTFEPEGQFDLVMSISALEHIADDRKVIGKLGRLVAPGGLQVHCVPSGWGLPVYLWHGYRQYTSALLAERFDPRATTLFAMGGAASFALHFVFISVAEFVFGWRVRRQATGLYRPLLDACLRLDRFVPVCATTYAVCRRAGDAE
ncbi:MAG: methyltransferase domain-containing protein [Vicinamibacterales bacterium]|jgi:SAM-dependent methyltransferase